MSKAMRGNPSIDLGIQALTREVERRCGPATMRNLNRRTARGLYRVLSKAASEALFWALIRFEQDTNSSKSPYRHRRTLRSQKDEA